MSAPQPESATAAGREVVAEARRQHQSAQRANRRFLFTARFGIVLVALVGWELISGTLVRPFYISSPSAVGERLFEWIADGTLLYHGQFTVTAAVGGYLLGAVAGVLVAWPLGMLRMAYRIFEPYFLVAYSVPAVAMGPVFILWFGIGMTPKVLIAAYFVFFIVFINTVAGFQQVPRGLLDVTSVMGASRGKQFRAVMLPSATPFILAALRITLPAAMIGAVTGEFISSNRGLGYITRESASQYATDGVIAGVLSLSVIVLVMNLMLRPLRNTLRWQQDVDVSRNHA